MQLGGFTPHHTPAVTTVRRSLHASCLLLIITEFDREVLIQLTNPSGKSSVDSSDNYRSRRTIDLLRTHLIP